MIMESLISVICVIVFIFNGNTDFLIGGGIFAIAAYLEGICRKISKESD